MAAEVIEGKDLMLFDKSAAFAVATSCKFTINANTLSVSSKDSGVWDEKRAGKLSWTASSDNLFTKEGYKKLVDLMIKREPIDLQFSTAVGSAGAWTPGGSDGYKGKAIITSVDANAPDGELATYSVSFEGTGPLSPVAASVAVKEG